MVACHLDVVPAGEGWDADPFALRVDRGKAIGRGVLDNKGPLAAMLMAARFLRENATLKGTFVLVAAADEECGSALGLEWLLSRGNTAPSMAIIPDIGGHMKVIDVAEKGVMFVEATAQGRQAHGSRPELGVNAIWIMADFLQRLRERPVPPGSHPLLTPSTCNLGRVEGGTAPNMVPARCTACLDIRYLPGQDPERILGHLEMLAEDVRRAHPDGELQLRVQTQLPPTEIPCDHPLVTALQNSVREVLGRTAKATGASGATVAKQLIARGIPAVGCGPGDEGQAHTANESIEIGDLAGLGQVLALTAARLLKANHA